MNRVSFIDPPRSAFVNFVGLAAVISLGCNDLLGIEPGVLAASGGSSYRGHIALGGRASQLTSGAEHSGTIGGLGGKRSVEFSSSVVGGGKPMGGSDSSAFSTFTSAAGTVNAGGASVGSDPGTGGSSSLLSGGAAGGIGATESHASSGGANALGGASTGSTEGCSGCEARELRLLESARTSRVIGNELAGRTFFDLCPDGHGLVGVAIRSGSDPLVEGPSFEGLGAICAPLEIVGGTSVGTGKDLSLPMRGMSGAIASVHCPPGEVVSGFSGRAQPVSLGPSALGINCAKVMLTRADLDAEIRVTITEHNALYGPGEVDVAEMCAPGQVANGLYVRAGSDVDAIGLSCASPNLAYPEGVPCKKHSDCLSENCSQICKPPRCLPMQTNCTCSVFSHIPYMFCTSAKLKKNAEYACSQYGMRLPKLDTPEVIGWLSTAMYIQNASRFWVNATYDDLQSPKAWSWAMEETIVSPAPDEVHPYNFWANASDALPAGGSKCLVLDSGNYASSSCDVPYPFACQLAE